MNSLKSCFIAIPLAILTSCGSPTVKKTAKPPQVVKESGQEKRTFQVRHELSVSAPHDAKKVRIWFTIPQETAAQEISDFKMDAEFPMKKVIDSHKNQYAYFEIDEPKSEKLRFVETFTIARSEVKSNVDAAKSRPLNEEERQELAEHLKPNEHVVIDEEIKDLARKVVGEEKNPVAAARKIYDWVLKNTEYWVKKPQSLKASKVGSAPYCLSSGTGNCTDFHSLYASIARAAGVPTQIVYGSLFKPELDGQDKDQSYHCWIEFYAPQIGWAPLDVAVADIFENQFDLNDENKTLVSLTTATGYSGPDAKLVDYYFGNLDARRVTWSRGRDLDLEPPQSGGPVNALPKAYIEVDGKQLPASNWTRKLTFKEVKN